MYLPKDIHYSVRLMFLYSHSHQLLQQRELYRHRCLTLIYWEREVRNMKVYYYYVYTLYVDEEQVHNMTIVERRRRNIEEIQLICIEAEKSESKVQ